MTKFYHSDGFQTNWSPTWQTWLHVLHVLWGQKYVLVVVVVVVVVTVQPKQWQQFAQVGELTVTLEKLRWTIASGEEPLGRWGFVVWGPPNSFLFKKKGRPEKITVVQTFGCFFSCFGIYRMFQHTWEMVGFFLLKSDMPFDFEYSLAMSKPHH